MQCEELLNAYRGATLSVANGFARACPWPGMNNLLAPCKFGLELSTRIFDEEQKLLVGAKEKVTAVMLLSSVIPQDCQ
ncbi:hypothetical protein CEXT_667991 [Caerostris extrusa]|uniref:Uncharacterized protein n=1 Tax=Caerostris extrusa TaxID=172846 RepID=A0AAV4X8R3_CAEEX|nr:hypothetical protein CEXT_667991 [Caerostris extrusa]